MSEKSVLITSMEKLINHIRKSEANQEEIFYSLSRTDFKKILSNLEDDNLVLRKTSLNLIAELLSSNSRLKTKFCQTMQINLIPGRIVLNSKTLQSQNNPISFKNILTLLKKELNLSNQKDILLWYINTKQTVKQQQVQYIERDKSRQQIQIDIDPRECIVGFCLTHSDLVSEYSTSSLSLPLTEASQSHKRMKLKSLIQSNPKKAISMIAPKLNSTITQLQPRYQRNNKTNQIQTERPKKFINTFIQQRKLNARGAETERHNVSNYEVSSITPTTQPSLNSFQNQQYQTMRLMHERSKRTQQILQQQHESMKQSGQFVKETKRYTMMPKTSQSPYIPTLNLQNASNNYGYHTDRRVDSFIVGKTQQSNKDMDFHKVKYQQGIKITTRVPTRNSFGNTDAIRSGNPERGYTALYSDRVTEGMPYMIPGTGVTPHMNGKGQLDQSFQFKYIKPMTTISTVNTEPIKNSNYFSKPPKDQSYMDKKTIDIFQFIKNK